VEEMNKLILSDYDLLIRFFEKKADWLGLPRNTGLVLTTMYLNKYLKDEKLSVDDICQATKYSRSNVGVILSKLEAMGIVHGYPNIANNGRGRRKILYTINPESKSLVTFGLKRTIDILDEFVESIDSLMEHYKDESPQIIEMLTDFESDSKKNLAIMKKQYR
jgi:DNA-binding transcriptional regulator GbsR (MarR family)